MPRHTATVPHALSRAEAVAHLTAAVARARTMSDLEATWAGDVLTFAVTMQGLSIRGTAGVEDHVIRIDCHLPLLAMAFRSWLPGIVAKALATPLPMAAISDRRPETAAPTLLFLHVPKAAGTTFAEFLHEHCADPALGADGLLREGVLYLPYGFSKPADLGVPEYVRRLLATSGLRAVVGHFWYGLHALVPGPSTYLTVLRDPVDRVWSLYRFLQLESEMSIEAFCETPPATEVDNDQVRRLAGVEPGIGECTEEMLQAAIAHLARDFALVGVTERLDETMVVARRTFGWPGVDTPPRRNVTASGAGTTCLTEGQRDAIRRRNALDCRLHAWANARLDQCVAHARTPASNRDSTTSAAK